MPWKSSFKNKKGYKTERTLVIILGGSIYDDGVNFRITNRRRRGDERFRKKQDIRLEEHLWQRDFKEIKAFFERENATVWRCIPTQLSSSRHESFSLINEFFQLDTIDRKAERKTFVIYWSGHGIYGTGNWGFTVGGEITCDDIVNAWLSRPMAGEHDDLSSLTIIADTCFSGAWIEQLREKNIPRLAYQAASRSDEPAYAVNDGFIPRSLLIRKFIIEKQYPIGWYVWTCSDQHPVHLCDYNASEDGEDLATGQRRTLVHGGSFYFFTVDQHLTENGKLSTAERKAQLAQLAQLAEYGTFMDDT